MSENTVRDDPSKDSAKETLRKTEEFRTWFFLTFVMAPVLAVIIVSGYGFLVWIYQMIAGPPSV